MAFRSAFNSLAVFLSAVAVSVLAIRCQSSSERGSYLVDFKACVLRTRSHHDSFHASASEHPMSRIATCSSNLRIMSAAKESSLMPPSRQRWSPASIFRIWATAASLSNT
eukprot:1107194-Pyramimonas_sp.AAC.1